MANNKKGKGQKVKEQATERVKEADIGDDSQCLEHGQNLTGKRREVRMRAEPAGVDSLLRKRTLEPGCSRASLSLARNGAVCHGIRFQKSVR